MILTDKKIACAAIRGGIKTQFGTLLECEIECCTGDNCNEGNNMKINSCVPHLHICHNARYLSPQWLLRGQMTSNNEPVSLQNL